MSNDGRPPFRADMVGSLLRTARLKDAREARTAGRMDGIALREVEDDEIRTLIRRQEEIGLQAVTDGEFRRAYWHFDFLEHLDGVTSVEANSSMNFKGGIGINEALRITGPIGFGDHPMIEHFRFLKTNTSRVAKMTIPGPSMLHYRGGRKMINAGLYRDMARGDPTVARGRADATKAGPGGHRDVAPDAERVHAPVRRARQPSVT